ncbi:hydroxyacylglutathione hydrolase [Uliginosibacterium sp. H3]|uniref:Hydroxyacylglutathione hydrolase n=1 Tax=Uliginosibacterium silvisoli TaxID=3114758 RepID=A0ABU6K3E8_9RHOO|nr:hydroxyacylglutathione hydrolase [Uliginosibacterium sp. H3]
MQIVPLPAFRDNYIWALIAHGQCIVVDPGEAAPVSRFLVEQDLQLSAILVTHRHNDHVGGVAELRERWPVPVFGPATIGVVTHHVGDGDLLTLPGVGGTATVLAVPGHTEEHIAFLHAGHLFCGDTLFAGGCGRLLGSSTAGDLHASLQRIAALPGETQICCAHEYTLSNLRFARAVEPDNATLQARSEACIALREAGQATLPSRLADELATNPFLRTMQPSVRHAAEQHATQALTDPAAVFAALRAWKDVF